MISVRMSHVNKTAEHSLSPHSHDQRRERERLSHVNNIVFVFFHLVQFQSSAPDDGKITFLLNRVQKSLVWFKVNIFTRESDFRFILDWGHLFTLKQLRFNLKNFFKWMEGNWEDDKKKGGATQFYSTK